MSPVDAWRGYAAPWVLIKLCEPGAQSQTRDIGKKSDLVLLRERSRGYLVAAGHSDLDAGGHNRPSRSEKPLTTGAI